MNNTSNNYFNLEFCQIEIWIPLIDCDYYRSTSIFIDKRLFEYCRYKFGVEEMQVKFSYLYMLNYYLKN